MFNIILKILERNIIKFLHNLYIKFKPILNIKRKNKKFNFECIISEQISVNM